MRRPETCCVLLPLSVFSILVGSVLGLSTVAWASPVTTFDGGGVEQLAGTINFPVEIKNNTRLIVESTGWIRATTSQLDTTGSAVFDTSRLTVSGGSITSTTSGPGSPTGVRAVGNAAVSISSAQGAGHCPS